MVLRWDVNAVSDAGGRGLLVPAFLCLVYFVVFVKRSVVLFVKIIFGLRV
jgi:hypothetical protein